MQSIPCTTINPLMGEQIMKKSLQTMAIAPVLASTFLVPSSTFAKDYSLEFPCPEEGEITAEGSWAPVSGAVDFSVESTDCVLRGEQTVRVNGTTTGTFKLTTEYVETDLVVHFEATVISPDGSTVLLTGYFDRTIKGKYDLLASQLDGTITNESTWTGQNISFSIRDLFAIDEIVDDED